jgi:uncharacterized membrane protein
MKVHLTFLIEKVKSSFWLIPTAITVALVGLLLIFTNLRITPQSGVLFKLLFSNISKEDARAILSSIATSVMTVVGVLFSIMIVVMQQASTQFAPRVVQNFTRSGIAQIVLGSYIGTFTYSLLLLSSFNGENLPKLAITFAIFLAIICLFLLIYYVYNVMTNVQSTQIIANITDEGVRTIQNIVRDSEKKTEDAPAIDEFDYSIDICSQERGYIQAVEWDKLRKPLKNIEWYARYHVSPGDYVQKGELIVTLYGRKPWNEKCQNAIYSTIVMGEIRTNSQDPLFSIQKLVDMGLKATSPSINDPSTAIEALHGIAALLQQFLERKFNHIVGIDHGWVEMPEITAEVIIGQCYDQLIQFSPNHKHILNVMKFQLEKALLRTIGKSEREAMNKRLEKVQEVIRNNACHY